MSLNVQLYATKMIPRDFKISGDPYEEMAPKQELVNMGVVYWRDENHNGAGVVLKQVFNETCFYSQLIVDDDFKVDEWTDEVLEAAKLNRNQPIEIPVNGSEKVSTEQDFTINKRDEPVLDGKAWVVFNQIRTVLSVTPTEVRTVG
jgi:hypothetical protein